MAPKQIHLDWLKVLERDEPAEGRVKPVTCGQRTLSSALARPS